MALFLLACESVPDQSLAQDNRFVKSANELSARNLAPGECGLFIWAGEARRFILFAQAGEGAEYVQDGIDVRLTAVPADVSGDLYGQIPVQSFTDTQGRHYDLNLSGANSIDGGIRYRSGTWRYKDSQGWSVVTSVYGLSTCQPFS